MVRSMTALAKDPDSPQLPALGLGLLITPAPGHLLPSSGLLRYLHLCVHTHTQNTSTHIL